MPTQTAALKRGSLSSWRGHPHTQWPGTFFTLGQGQARRLSQAQAEPATEPQGPRFDDPKAVKLAAFAFAVYGDPSGSRWFRTPDGTDIGTRLT